MITNVLFYNGFAGVALVVFGSLGFMVGFFLAKNRVWVGSLLGALVGVSIILIGIAHNRPPANAKPMTDVEIASGQYKTNADLIRYERRYYCDKATQIGFLTGDWGRYVLVIDNHSILASSPVVMLTDEASRAKALACYQKNRQIF